MVRAEENIFLRKSFQNFSSLIALPHTVFALPFALSSYLFAWKKGTLAVSSLSEWQRFVMVVFCLVFARTSAMAFNRLVDAGIDSENPRTIGRDIPQGRVSRGQAIGLTVISLVLFLFGCAVLGMHCLMLSPLVLLILLGYSLTKRFTAYSHLVLGLALAAAPGGAWWVLRPMVELEPLLLMLGVLLWVAGFDILYSCQDTIFDRRKGLHSIPAAIGIERSLSVSTQLHVICLFSFLLLGQILSLNWTYFVGMAMFGALLWWQHRLLSPFDLSRINQAFFVANGCISLCFLVLSGISVYLG